MFEYENLKEYNISNYMEIGSGIIVGILLGGVIAYFGVQAWLKNINKSKIEEANKQADLLLQSAKLDVKKLEDEASIKASKLIDNAERKNEQIKQ